MSVNQKAAIQELVFAFPGDLMTPTGGYAYDRRIIQGLQQLGWNVHLLSLGDGFPLPSPDCVARARQLLLDLPLNKPVVMDGLALGVLPEVVAALAERNPVIALVHHPLALESGLSSAQSAAFKASESQALQSVRQVIANSPSTARDLMTLFDIPLQRIEIVYPGTDRITPASHVARRSHDSEGPFHFLSVGSIIPRKGYRLLLQAMHALKSLPWTLSIVGDTTRDFSEYQRLQNDIALFALEDRVHLLGAISDDELKALYEKADAFVLASMFEGYGMAYAEAMVYGLPVIGTTGGAIADTVPHDAGLLVKPGDLTGLVDACRRLMQDRECYTHLSLGAASAGARLPTWTESVDRFASIVSRFTS